MRILLRTDVEGLGTKGEVLEVSEGYARNYLVPKGMAIQATAGIETQAEAMRRSRVRKDAHAKANADDIARRLVPAVIQVAARVGNDGHLYGSVTTVDVAAAVQEQLGIELDRRILTAEAPIRSVGTHEVRARLHAEVLAIITVEVSALA